MSVKITDGVADDAMLTRSDMTPEEIVRSLNAHADHMDQASNLGDLLRQAARAIEARGADTPELLEALRPFAAAYAGVSDLKDYIAVVRIGDTTLRPSDFARAARAIASAERLP